MPDTYWVKRAKRLACGYVAVNKAHTTYYPTNGGRYTVFELAAQDRLGLAPKETVRCVKQPSSETYPIAGKHLRVQEIRFYDINEGVLQRTPRFLVVMITQQKSSHYYNIYMTRTEFWQHFKKEEE